MYLFFIVGIHCLCSSIEASVPVVAVGSELTGT